MSIAPWQPDAGSLIRFQHGHQVSATLTDAAGSTITALQVESGQVDFDETRAPRVQARLTARIPDDQATLDAADPRARVRVQISAGYVWPGGLVDSHPLADLALRSRDVDRPADTFELSAQSDESLVMDDSPVSGTNLTGTPLTLIASLVNACFPTARTFVIDPGVSDTAAVTLESVDDRMTAVNDLADQLGARVYDAGDRTWHVGPSVVAASTAQAILNVGAGGLLERTSTSTSRDDFANVVVLEYRWRDAAGVDRRILGTASQATGPYTASAGNRKTLWQRRDTATTQAAGNTAAASVLARMVQRGRAFTLTAVSAYWLRPGMSITAQLPLGPAERHIIRAVTFDLETETMTLSTRRPE